MDVSHIAYLENYNILFYDLSLYLTGSIEKIIFIVMY
jgi:hypothetical protein